MMAASELVKRLFECIRNCLYTQNLPSTVYIYALVLCHRLVLTSSSGDITDSCTKYWEFPVTLRVSHTHFCVISRYVISEYLLGLLRSYLADPILSSRWVTPSLNLPQSPVASLNPYFLGPYHFQPTSKMFCPSRPLLERTLTTWTDEAQTEVINKL